jgi:hypothetical protein
MTKKEKSAFDAIVGNAHNDATENDLGELAELLIQKIKAEIDDNGTPPEKKARLETDLTELAEIVYIVDIGTDYDADTVRVGPMPAKQVSAVLDADKTFSGPHISRDFLGYADELIKDHTYLNSANRGQSI